MYHRDQRYRLLFFAGLWLALAGCAWLNLQSQQALEKLRNDAQAAKTQVEQKLRDNPYSALENSLGLLDSILNYAERVKSDPSQFSEDKLLAYQKKIQIIEDNLSRFSDLALQADVSFPLGQYRAQDLSEYARQESERLVEKILASVTQLQARYPNQPILVTLKIAGYTDETPFAPGTALEKAILRELGGEAPAEPARKRAAYNRILSGFRAQSVGEYLWERIFAGRRGWGDIQLKIFGAGETLPEKPVDPPYQPTDPRRRLSIVSPFVEVVLQ